MRLPAASRLLIVALIAASAALGGAWLHLNSTVSEALHAPSGDTKALQFVPLPASSSKAEQWGGGEIDGVALAEAGLVVAGGSGVDDARARWNGGLPTLRASSLALWRGRPVVGLVAGRLFRRGDDAWDEMRSGFGTLHVRCLVETPAGELVIGAREGLFRVAWGASDMQRLDRHPVRSVAVGRGWIVAGGEEGLRRVESGRANVIATNDPWIETVEIIGSELFAVTATGLESGALDGPLAASAAGGDVVSGVAHEGRFYGLTDAPATVRRFEGPGRSVEVLLPATPRRLMTSRGALFVDTDRGLYQRGPDGFALVRPRRDALPPGPSHVTALARLGDSLVAGLFDGGLAVAERQDGRLRWRGVAGSSAWGVNALLPVGGVLFVASLRGAARFDGTRLTPLDGPGAAFSLAATNDGVAVGYAQGVLLPGARFLSAFHGLPGNQALALASGTDLVVGTPSGLGGIEGRRVAWRVVSGDGKLPHTWVTALLPSAGALYVGTYGGGITRRTAAAHYEPFVETEGLKVNAGCLVEVAGRVYAGTDGRGLWRLSADGTRFEALSVLLPSPHVTALLGDGDSLWVGTDEGLAHLPRVGP